MCGCAAKDREIERLTALLNKPPPMPKTWAQAKLRAEPERKARRAAARAAKPEIPDEKTKEENQRAKLQRIDQADKVIFESPEDRRFALAHFHPDRAKPDKRHQANRVFQLLNNIPVIDD